MRAVVCRQADVERSFGSCRAGRDRCLPWFRALRGGVGRRQYLRRSRESGGHLRAGSGRPDYHPHWDLLLGRAVAWSCRWSFSRQVRDRTGKIGIKHARGGLTQERAKCLSFTETCRTPPPMDWETEWEQERRWWWRSSSPSPSCTRCTRRRPTRRRARSAPSPP